MNAHTRHTLTARELRWMRHLAIHGPLPSTQLLDLVSDTHRCRDTGLRTLKRLRDAGYLRLPPQQRQIAKADFNPYVYDLTRQAELYLRGLGDPVTVRPKGHWWHSFATACVSSSLHIQAERRGDEYIPAHTILNRQGASLSVPDGRQKLIPDQLFAIKSAHGFRSYVLEVDRGTEPLQSKTARKSLRSSLEQYADLHAKDAIRRHYGLKSPVLFLFVFTNPVRAAKCQEYVSRYAPTLEKFVRVSVIEGGFPRSGMANLLYKICAT